MSSHLKMPVDDRGLAMRISTNLKYSGALLLLLIGLPGAHAQGYAWGSLSSDDAIQVVRNFEGDQTLAVSVTQMPAANPGGPAPEYGYTLTAGVYKYFVCEYTPDLVDRDYENFIVKKDEFYGQPYDAATLQQSVMSQDAAQSIAQAFMQAHYPAPQLLQAPVASTDFNSDPAFTATYSFEFTQDCGGGVSGPSFCSVTVDTVLGRVVFYDAGDFPTLVSAAPYLSVDQAMASAMNGLNITNGLSGTVMDLGITKPDPLGAEQLYYRLRFSGVGPADPTGPPEWYQVVVDANSGAVLEWDVEASLISRTRAGSSLASVRRHMAKRSASRPASLGFLWGGAHTRLSYPPLLIHGHPYLWVGYLCYGEPRARAAYNRTGSVEVHGAGRNLRVGTQSTRWRLNGINHRSAAAAVMVDGHCYVPLDVVGSMLPFTVHYDARKKQVSFEPQKVSSRKLSGTTPRTQPPRSARTISRSG